MFHINVTLMRHARIKRYYSMSNILCPPTLAYPHYDLLQRTGITQLLQEMSSSTHATYVNVQNSQKTVHTKIPSLSEEPLMTRTREGGKCQKLLSTPPPPGLLYLLSLTPRLRRLDPPPSTGFLISSKFCKSNLLAKSYASSTCVHAQVFAGKGFGVWVLADVRAGVYVRTYKHGWAQTCHYAAHACLSDTLRV
jgi:hypothetical protein